MMRASLPHLEAHQSPANSTTHRSASARATPAPHAAALPLRQVAARPDAWRGGGVRGVRVGASPQSGALWAPGRAAGPQQQRQRTRLNASSQRPVGSEAQPQGVQPLVSGWLAWTAVVFTALWLLVPAVRTVCSSAAEVVATHWTVFVPMAVPFAPALLYRLWTKRHSCSATDQLPGSQSRYCGARAVQPRGHEGAFPGDECRRFGARASADQPRAEPASGHGGAISGDEGRCCGA